MRLDWAASRIEYAIEGLNNRIAFFALTTRVCVAGRMPKAIVASSSRAIRVYADRTYVFTEKVGASGMLVLDLTRLRDAEG